MSQQAALRIEAASDAELVAAVRAGDTGAFEQIVCRYQGLVCGVAFSATGSQATSEDVAQETFLAAWKERAALRDANKLRPWLCGIARNRARVRRRREVRELVRPELPEAASDGPSPLDELIDAESEAMVWRALREIPER